MVSLKKFVEQLNEKEKVKKEKIISPGIKPKLKKIKGITLAFFDIYGTLLTAKGAGIETIAQQKELLPFEKTIKEFYLLQPLKKINAKKKPALLLKEIYLHEVKREVKKKKRKETFPEILIEKVWEKILRKLMPEKKAKSLGEESKKIAYFFAFAWNRSHFYPNALNALIELKKKKIILGIASNSQFYTKINLNIQIKKETKGKLRSWKELFNEKLCFFSFELGISKPGPLFFKKIIRELKKKNIFPSSVMLIGNDLSKDIFPAKKLGFKTVLFAGDKNSLKLNKKPVKPDAIITNWQQLQKII